MLSRAVTGLAVLSTFSFQVLALTVHGLVGASSSAVIASTGEPSQPTLVLGVGVNKTRTTGGSLVIRWTQPVDPGGVPIVRYRVYVDDMTSADDDDPTGADDDSVRTLAGVVSASYRELAVFGLLPRRTYSTCVKAVNDALLSSVCGKAAVAVVGTSAATRPTPPLFVLFSTIGFGMGTLTWAPPQDTGGLRIDNYTVTSVSYPDGGNFMRWGTTSSAILDVVDLPVQAQLNVVRCAVSFYCATVCAMCCLLRLPIVRPDRVRLAAFE